MFIAVAPSEQKILKDYDIIVCGGGLAGLSLVYRAFKSGVWCHERVLIIDKETKQDNDRTWSFWQQSPLPFDDIVHHQWKQLVFFSNSGEKIQLDHLPYTYNTIRSIDFYHYVQQFLSQLKNVEQVKQGVKSLTTTKNGCVLETEKSTYTCKFAFSSLFKKPSLGKSDQYFLQHFKGMRIKTQDISFNTNEGFLMDFRTGQENGTTFFYTLPMKTDEVFIEYTLFSKHTLREEIYDQKIAEYVKNVLGIKNYQVLESEFGVIPMTDFKFKRHEGNITYIGTAGGDTRGSTGYTFANVQKTITGILKSYSKTGSPLEFKEHIGNKELLYDATLLNVLDEGNYKGHQLFTDLFKHTKAFLVFNFLDGESSLFKDVMIMKSLKTWPFLKSFVKVNLSKLKQIS